jgi:hypothetical protein
VPDFVTTFTTDPALRPYSAPNACVRILNSSMASGGGLSTKPVLKVSLLVAPSIRKLLDWLRIPLTLKPPVALPKPPGVASPCCPPRPEGGATTPGISVPSCVKLRPFSGRSTTFCWSMTMPCVAFEVSTSVASAVTVMVSLICPTSSWKTARAVSVTVTRTPSCCAVLKPASDAFTL